jgi:hypothetical protein
MLHQVNSTRALLAICAAVALTMPTAHAADAKSSTRVVAGITFGVADQDSRDIGLSLGIDTSRGFTFDARVGRTESGEADEQLEPRSWSLRVGKRWERLELSAGYSDWDDEVQTATSDFSIGGAWLGERGSLALDVGSGKIEQLQIVQLPMGGSVPVQLDSDRLMLGLSGTLDVSERVTLNAGVTTYDYEDDLGRLNAFPRLAASLINSTFTARNGVVDLVLDLGVSVSVGRGALGLAFARSRNELDGAQSSDVQLAYDFDLGSRWAMTTEVGYFEPDSGDAAVYGGLGLRLRWQ